MERPVAVTAFGVLNVIFSVLGVLGLMASVAMIFASSDTNNPAIRVMQNSPGYKMWLMVATPLGCLSCVMLLAAGIGLLKMRGWARWLSIAYGVYALVFGLIGMVFNYLFLVGPLLAEAARAHGPEAGGAIGGAIGGSIGGCASLIYPVLLIIFMTRPNVKAALKEAAAERARA